MFADRVYSTDVSLKVEPKSPFFRVEDKSLLHSCSCEYCVDRDDISNAHKYTVFIIYKYSSNGERQYEKFILGPDHWLPISSSSEFAHPYTSYKYNLIHIILSSVRDVVPCIKICIKISCFFLLPILDVCDPADYNLRFKSCCRDLKWNRSLAYLEGGLVVLTPSEIDRNVIF